VVLPSFDHRLLQVLFEFDWQERMNVIVQKINKCEKRCEKENLMNKKYKKNKKQEKFDCQ
jgi:hypothetical protein